MKVQRFEELDGLRGVCALLVALYHCHIAGHLYGSQFLKNCHLWVDFFFLLSGFVITHAYAGRMSTSREFRSFLVKRFWRLWPLHVFVLALFVVLELGKLLAVSAGSGAESQPFTGRTSLASLITNIFLVQSLGIHGDLTWNRPAWSISVEFYTYILFGAFSWLCAAKVPTKSWLNASSVGSACLAIIAGAVVVSLSSRLMDVTYELGFARCVYGFFVGSLAYHCYSPRRAVAEGILSAESTEERRSFRLGASLREALVVALVVGFVVYFGDTRWSYATPMVFVLPLLVFSDGLGAVSALLRLRIFQLLGVLSYSVYMVHSFLLESSLALAKLAEKLVGIPLVAAADKYGTESEVLASGNPWVGDAITVVYIAVVLMAAGITYRFVELPGNRLGKRLASRPSVGLDSSG